MLPETVEKQFQNVSEAEIITHQNSLFKILHLQFISCFSHINQSRTSQTYGL